MSMRMMQHQSLQLLLGLMKVERKRATQPL